MIARAETASPSLDQNGDPPIPQAPNPITDTLRSLPPSILYSIINHSWKKSVSSYPSILQETASLIPVTSGFIYNNFYLHDELTIASMKNIMKNTSFIVQNHTSLIPGLL